MIPRLFGHTVVVVSDRIPSSKASGFGFVFVDIDVSGKSHK